MEGISQVEVQLQEGDAPRHQNANIGKKRSASPAVRFVKRKILKRETLKLEVNL